MKSLFLLPLIVVLVGCGSTCVIPTTAFPEPPAVLLKEPAPLSPIKEDVSDINTFLTEVGKNYGKYFEQSEQLRALQGWVKEQKELTRR